MNKGLFLVVLVLFSSGMAYGQAEANSSDNAVEVTFSSAFSDKYLSPWSGSVYDRRYSSQSDITVTFPNGFYASLWLAKQFGKVREGLDGNELDGIIGEAFEKHGATIDVSLSYYDLSPIMNGRANNIWAGVVKVSKAYTFADVEVVPFIRGELDIPEAGSDFSGGSLLTVGFETSVLMEEGFSFQVNHYYTYDSGSFGGDENVILGLSASAKFEIAGLECSFPNLVLTTPLSEDSDRKFEACSGFSVNGGF